MININVSAFSFNNIIKLADFQIERTTQVCCSQEKPQ